MFCLCRKISFDVDLFHIAGVIKKTAKKEDVVIDDVLKVRQSDFVKCYDPKGLPETNDVFGLDRIQIKRKRFFCPNPAHTRWEEYYEVSIDGTDYDLFNWEPHDSNIAEVYPGRNYGRTVIRIKQEVCDALTEMDAKSSRGRDCVNPGALRRYYKDLYEEYLRFHKESKEGGPANG